MSDGYIELLDATIQHLTELKAEGTKWIAVQPEVLARLGQPTARKATPAPARTPTHHSSPPPMVREPLPAQAPAPPAPMVPAERVKPLTAENKAAAMAELRARALACTQCVNLANSRQNVVFGVGNIDSQLLFIGEAPGADEDVQGEPFVGAAGQLLTRIIKAMGFTRETVYIANVLKCRPDTPGQDYGNRKPSSLEMQTCLPYLLEQIQIIQPKVIVALGATAMEGLFGRPVPITRVRGTWQTLNGTPVMPTFHPSYLLRNQAPAVKRQVWEDMLQVLEKLGATITEKQRNFFKT